jgi:uncharacterized protein YjbJ (UPF0337 family)
MDNNNDQVEGTAKEPFGALKDNDELSGKGLADQAVTNVSGEAEDLVDRVKDALDTE